MPRNEHIRLEDELCGSPYKLLQYPQTDDPSEGSYKAACHMVGAHNLFVRFLNSVYLQAEGVEKDGTKEDIRAFLWYIQLLSTRLHRHHDAEENVFFPSIRNAGNDQSLLTHAVDQHEAFSKPLRELDDYVEQAMGGKTRYSGAKIKQLIDKLGSPLHQHLADEIDDLLALKGRVPGPVVHQMMEEWGDNEKKEAKLTEDVPMALGMLRAGPGNEQHAIELPAILKYLTAYALWWKHSDSWQFLPCDHNGVPKSELAFYKP